MDQRTEEVNARTEPIIDQGRLRNAVLFLYLGEGRHQQAFWGTRYAAQEGPSTACRQIVTF